jgi:hypothetical protein
MLGAFALGTSGPEASAMTVFGGTSPVVQRDSAVQLVAEHRKVKKEGHNKKVWVYKRSAHGARYRYSHGPYRYYYGGYYYAQPWWTIGVPGINLCIGC